MECERIVHERLKEIRDERARQDVVFNRFVKQEFNKVKE